MKADLLSTILTINIAMSLTIFAVLFLRRPVRRWLGASNAYVLWLLVPVSAFAVLLPARKVTVAVPELSTNPITNGTLNTEPAILAPALETAAPTTQTNTLSLAELWEPLLLVVWVCGILLSLFWLYWRQYQFESSLGALEPVTNDETKLFRTHKNGFGPALVGALFPRLVVPQDFDEIYNAQERALVIAHEQVHMSRYDAQVNWLAYIISCLFWFNPVLPFAMRYMREDQEIACDAVVLRQQAHNRHDYAQAMLKTQLSEQHAPLGCAWPPSGKHPLINRVMAIKDNTPSGSLQNAGTMIIGLLAIITCTAAWAAQPAVIVTAAAPAKASANNTLPAAEYSYAYSVSETKATENKEKGSYIESLRAAGMDNLTVDQLISMKIHNVSPAMIASIREAGFDPTPDQLVGMAVANVTPQFIANVREQGWPDVEIQDLISMKHMNVDPADAKRFEAAGIEKPSLRDLIRFSSHNITPEFVQALRAEGITDTEPRAYIRAASMNVTPAFVREARERGFTKLTLKQLARLKNADVF
jgi:beta-lactamase regulating signal transducer with metallopeptidase domain